MATIQTKSRPPELSPTPEEPRESDVDDNPRGALPRSKATFNLQERLLSCGSFDALIDNDDRMGRRPSTASLDADTSIREHPGDEAAKFSSLKRVLLP